MERYLPLHKAQLVFTALLLSIMSLATQSHAATTPALYLMPRGYMPEHTPTYAQTTAQACQIVLDYAHVVALRDLIRPLTEGAALPSGDDSYSRALPVMILSQGNNKPDWIAYRSRTRQNEIIWQTVGPPSQWAGVSDEIHLYEETDRIFTDLTLPRREGAMCGLLKWHFQHKKDLSRTN